MHSLMWSDVERRMVVRLGVEEAIKDDPHNQCYGPGKEYSTKYVLESAILSLYWPMCTGLEQLDS